MAVAAADGATDDAMTEVRGAGIAGPALGADMAIDFPDGATLGFAMAPTLPPSEPVASVSYGLRLPIPCSQRARHLRHR